MVREKLVIVLTLIIMAFCIGLLIKHEVVTVDILSEKNVVVGVIKDLITIIAIILGATLTYFKFFAGQTFTPKADIDFQVSIIETPEDKLLHTVKVTVINKGSLTIWNPVAQIKVERWGESEKSNDIVKQFIEEHYLDNDKEHQAIIDPGESVHFVIWRRFEKHIWAITYRVEISSSSGRKWQDLVTIPNKVNTKANTV